MPATNTIEITSYDEAVSNIELIIEKFKKDSVVVLRNLNITTEEQAEFARTLGDKIGWFPNHSHEFNQRYRENHERVSYKEAAGPDAIVVPWHMEHVDFDEHTPIIGGVWNMLHFTADPNTGKTYFVDTTKIYNSLSTEDQEFLSKSTVTWHEADGSGPFRAPAVQDHWLTKEKTIRIDTRTQDDKLSQYEGQEPNDEQQAHYRKLKNFFMDQVRDNEEIRTVHKWQQGDLLIVDLFKNVHAVTGGFDSKDRLFTGEWAYPKNPETREFLDFIDNVVAKRADG
jgi:alpha-ketoglutarate-dependent taurine dioxygenase